MALEGRQQQGERRARVEEPVAARPEREQRLEGVRRGGGGGVPMLGGGDDGGDRFGERAEDVGALGDLDARGGERGSAVGLLPAGGGGGGGHQRADRLAAGTVGQGVAPALGEEERPVEEAPAQGARGRAVEPRSEALDGLPGELLGGRDARGVGGEEHGLGDRRRGGTAAVEAPGGVAHPGVGDEAARGEGLPELRDGPAQGARRPLRNDGAARARGGPEEAVLVVALAPVPGGRREGRADGVERDPGGDREGVGELRTSRAQERGAEGAPGGESVGDRA